MDRKHRYGIYKTSENGKAHPGHKQIPHDTIAMGGKQPTNKQANSLPRHCGGLSTKKGRLCN